MLDAGCESGMGRGEEEEMRGQRRPFYKPLVEKN